MNNVLMRGTVLALAIGVLNGCSTIGVNMETACVLGGAAIGGGAGATNNSEDAVKGAIGGALVGALACHLMDGDSDEDGVKDSKDMCVATPLGDNVDENGCSIAPVVEEVVEVDTDMDGVIDSVDLCPNTPAGDDIDADGCTLAKVVVLDNINFNFSSAKPAAEASEMLMAQVEVLQANPNLDVSLVGHTDNTGPAEFNQKLSVERAMAIRDFFVAQGICADIFTVSGMGEMEPIADNSTKEGRSANRRVVMTMTPKGM